MPLVVLSLFVLRDGVLVDSKDMISYPQMDVHQKNAELKRSFWKSANQKPARTAWNCVKVARLGIAVFHWTWDDVGIIGPTQQSMSFGKRSRQTMPCWDTMGYQLIKVMTRCFNTTAGCGSILRYPVKRLMLAF